MSESSCIESDPTLALRRLARTDLHLLSVFMTVVAAGGFSAAQVALNVGQSTVSRHMADLESRLGMRLCQRGRVGFRLTDKGRMVHGACQRLFAALEGFRTEMGAISGQLVGELSLAVVDNWIYDAASPLTAALAEIKARGPAIRVNLHTLAPDKIALAVLDGGVSLGIGVFHHRQPGLDYQLLYQDPLELYCGKGHPLFDAESVPRDLGGADYVRRGYLAEDKAAPQVAQLPSSATAHQMEGVAYLILTGQHIGYLPVSYATRWLAEGAMRALLPEVYRVQTKIEIATKKAAALSLVGRTFLEVLLGLMARQGTAPTDGPSQRPSSSQPPRSKPTST